MINYLQQIIATLNQVETRGKDNLDMLLGSIMALEDLVKELSKPDDNAIGKETDAQEDSKEG